MYHATVVVTLRSAILDPQGKAVEHALQSLNINGISRVRLGKRIEMDIDAATHHDAEQQTEEICKKLLANPVMEDYSYTVAVPGE